MILLKNLVNKNFKHIFTLTDNVLLNMFFWISIFALFYSFGYPFILGLEDWVNYIGQLKQIRALGRFTWLFFYIINIIAAYKIYFWITRKNIFWKYFILLIAFFVLSIDVYFSINKHQDSLYASIEQLKDEKNNLPENQWIKTINVANYQAIIPLPYTHIGSENVWIAPKSDMMKNVLTISLKTGLPTMAVTMSRTSLSQTYKNIPLVLEPYKPL